MSDWYYYQDHWQMYHKVTFDGPNKLILVNEGVTELDVRQDLYSDWKEWFDHQNPDGLVNAKYLYAMRAVGGDALPGDQVLGSTFFLSNGWRIKPYSGSYTLVVRGNLYTDEGDFPFIDADGNLNNIKVISVVSTLVERTGVGSADEVKEAVWSADITEYEDDEDSAGQAVNDIKRNTQLIPATL